VIAFGDKTGMHLIYTPEATAGLLALPKADAKRIREALEQVVRSHPQRMPFVTEMVGRPGFWRLRKGNWRAIYRVDGGGLTVESVGKRGDIYR
jgi:mRNA-degrading endonuclease RelE of RelBE toxin-antitoxin system